MSANSGFRTHHADEDEDDQARRRTARSPRDYASVELRATDYALRHAEAHGESADGDIGVASLRGDLDPTPRPFPEAGSSPAAGADSTAGPSSTPTRQRPTFIDLPLPELQLPDPALVVPQAGSPAAATARRRRRSILSSSGSKRSPAWTLSPTSPRARPDLPRTGTASPELAAPVPLKPILQNPLTPAVARPWAGESVGATVAPAAHDANSLHRERSPSPVFAPRDDDEPHPEHGMHPEQRTPHPLYTPAPKRRRRRKRRNGSVTSARSSRSGRSARSRVKRALRKVQRRRRRGSTAGGSVTSGTATSSASSSTSSSSSTTSSSSTSSSSGRTNSTWAGWRFWRNSSSGSSSSSSDDTDSDADSSEWDPPTPHFKLLTPVLSRPTLHYPAHLFSGATPTPVLSAPTTATGVLPPGGAASAPDQAAPVFELANSTSLAPALERLAAFWQERQQEDGIAGDLGAGVYNPGEAPLRDLTPTRLPPTPAAADEQGYFPPDAAQLAATETHAGGGGTSSSRAGNAPALAAATPAVTPGVFGGPSTKRGREQARTARMEFRRLGKNREMRNGPAWWLDIMCPTVADMRELRKHLPLHPLTIEDVLHQETREKLESFPALGYYFIVFRALDESYFKYTSTSQPPSPASSSSSLNEKRGEGSEETKPDQPAPPRQRGRVDIVEGVGGKEGVEGVGVGAVNMYLIVFGDGILSFHFEPIDKHLEIVQGKLQQYGNSRNFSSHWMAYSLMDSVVDAFFPIMDFVDYEANELDVFSVGPNEATTEENADGASPPAKPKSMSGKSGGYKHYDGSVVGIQVDSPSEQDLEKLSRMPTNSTIKRATVERVVPVNVLRGALSIPISATVAKLLPRRLLTRALKPFRTKVLVDEHGIELQTLTPPPPRPNRGLVPDGVSVSAAAKHTLDAIMLGKTPRERAAMLQRITQMRRIVTGLNRLLGPKTDVVRGLRKRVLEEDAALFRGDFKHDIAVYIGDLQDHILAMQQSLIFYDATLAHDHPAYLSILRFSLQYAKRDTDINFIKLYLIGLTVLLLNIITGLFSINVERPHNGTSEAPHVEADGSPAPLYWFGIVLVILFVATHVLGYIVYLIFRSSRNKHAKRGPALR